MSSRRGAAVGVLLGLLGLNGALEGQQECTLGDDGPIRRGRRCSTAPLRPGFGKTAGGVASLAEGERIVVPIAYHVVRMAGEPELPVALIELQTAVLNAAFQGTRISFTTASVSQPVFRWRRPVTAGCPPRRVTMRAVVRDLESRPEEQLNVYLINDFSAEAFGEAGDGIVMGWDYLPYQREIREIPDVDAREVASTLFGEGETLVHLVGHYLGLDDTFLQVRDPSDPETGELLPVWQRCKRTSDLVSDTAVHVALDVGASLPRVEAAVLRRICVPRDTCKKYPGTDPLSNYMADEADLCAAEFSRGQVERMHATVVTSRPGLVVVDSGSAN